MLPKPPIRYSDVVCLITGHDAEWSRSEFPTPKVDFCCERVFEEIRGICKCYADGITSNSQSAHPEEANHRPDAYLFRPLEYLPMGHADALAITLFDDLDPIHNLSAQCSTTVEEVAVGFAPMVQSLANSDDKHRFAECVIDITRFVGMASDQPLLMFSRVKLGAMGLLGGGLEFQAAVFRAVAHLAPQTLQILAELPAETKAEFEIEDTSLDATRVCLLDLQGQEEVGILVACDNYTIAASLLSRIQCLTLAELEGVQTTASSHQDLVSKIVGQDWVSAARSLVQDMSDAPQLPSDLASNLKSSHALRWTRTTLAIRRQAFHDPRAAGVKGYMDVVSVLNISVGHQQPLDDILDQTTSSGKIKSTRLYRHLMGHADLLVHQSNPGRDPERFIPTWQAFQNISNIVRDAMKVNEAGAMPRHLGGLASLPTIPIPASEKLRPDLKPHFPILQKILPVVRWRMVDLENAEDREEGYDIPEIRKRQQVISGRKLKKGICPLTLCREPRKYLMPSSLVRTVQYLYQNYTTLLANPFVFDAALDQYDSFATFYDVLTKHFKDLYGYDKVSYPFWQIPAEVVSQVSQYVGALHRALEHRLYHAFPEETNREMDVDFRGGLNQLISGADALVKSAVGMVKRHGVKRDGDLDPSTNYSQFGVVNRIDFEPEIVATSLWLGVETKARLSIIRSDVPHLCVVASYLDFVHEVGHIAFSERRHPRSLPSKGSLPTKNQCPLLPLIPIRSDTERLLGEIYTHMLTGLLVCRDDPESLAKHQMVNFALTTRYGADALTRYVSFLRYAFQTFIGTKCAEGINHYLKSNSHPGDQFGDSIYAQFFGAEEAALSAFKRFVDNYHRLCHDADQIKRNLAANEVLEQVFRHSWQTIPHSLPVLIEDVTEVFMEYCSKGVNMSVHQMGEHVNRLRSALEKEDNQGIPVLFLASELASNGSSDIFHMLCSALGTALRFRMKRLDMDKVFHVPVNHEDGKIRFPEVHPEKGYSDYMVRTKDSSLFCCKPKLRRERLRRQICLFKTLWHTSFKLKADRFNSLIKNALSIDE